jgi:hypothetical protein
VDATFITDDSVGGIGFALPATLIAVVLLAIVGVVALARAAVGASSPDSAEDAMERPHRFAQLYGYAVCLIAVVLFLTSATGFVEALIDASDPLHAVERGDGEASLPASFDVYRAEYRDPALQAMAARERFRFSGESARQPAADAPRTLSDAELRQVYDAKRRELLDAQRFRTRRSLLTSAFGMLLAAALFAAHWRWLRRLPAGERLASSV